SCFKGQQYDAQERQSCRSALVDARVATHARRQYADHGRARPYGSGQYRRRSLSRRAILDMELRIFAIADELAAELFADGSPADLVERYARKLPLSVICELLGLPRAASNPRSGGGVSPEIFR